APPNLLPRAVTRVVYHACRRDSTASRPRPWQYWVFHETGGSPWAEQRDGWKIVLQNSEDYLQDWHVSAQGNNETGYAGGGEIGPSLEWQGLHLEGWGEQVCTCEDLRV